MWYNVIDKNIQNETERPSRIEPGFYSFQQFADVFQKRYHFDLLMSMAYCLWRLKEIKLSNGLKKLRGLRNKGRFAANQTYEGETPLDFAVIKTLYIYLLQINTSQNYFKTLFQYILSIQNINY